MLKTKVKMIGNHDEWLDCEHGYIEWWYRDAGINYAIIVLERKFIVVAKITEFNVM